MSQLFFNAFCGTVTPQSRPSLRRSALAMAGALADGWSDYLRRRRDHRHLEELPDYLLDDIGLTRADISPRRWTL